MPETAPTIFATFQHAMPDGRPCPDLLTHEEAIQYLRLDKWGVRDPKRTLMRLCQEGQLRGTRMGRGTLFRLEELQRFSKAKEQETNSPAAA